MRTKKKVITIKKLGCDSNADIHSLARADYDRDIILPRNHQYAVVLAAYYLGNGKGYTTHKTLEQAKDAYYNLQDQGYSAGVIDIDGQDVILY